MHKWIATVSTAVLLLVATGCATSFDEKANNGITFYCPGAGNYDGGQIGVKEGLQKAGYPGQVYPILWTVSFSVTVDQFFKRNAEWGGKRLAQTIEEYIDEYPGRPVNIIGLSAGTGVALYTCENLSPGYQVDNVILLSGSVSCDYDVSKALKAVRGKIYNFYSDRDIVLLGPMKVAGTIDGKWGVDGAGTVGLCPELECDQIINIGWRPEFRQYGNYGGHTDPTNSRFVEAVLAPYVVMPEEARIRRIITAELAQYLRSMTGQATLAQGLSSPQTDVANPQAKAVPAASQH